MKIYAQTAFTPKMLVYDSTLPDTAGGMGKAVKAIVRPVIQVTDDSGTPMYKTGEFYTPWVMYGSIALITLLMLNFADKSR
jgi:hypothetical protein